MHPWMATGSPRVRVPASIGAAAGEGGLNASSCSLHWEGPFSPPVSHTPFQDPSAVQASCSTTATTIATAPVHCVESASPSSSTISAGSQRASIAYSSPTNSLRLALSPAPQLQSCPQTCFYSKGYYYYYYPSFLWHSMSALVHQSPNKKPSLGSSQQPSSPPAVLCPSLYPVTPLHVVWKLLLVAVVLLLLSEWLLFTSSDFPLPNGLLPTAHAGLAGAVYRQTQQVLLLSGDQRLEPGSPSAPAPHLNLDLSASSTAPSQPSKQSAAVARSAVSSQLTNENDEEAAAGALAGLQSHIRSSALLSRELTRLNGSFNSGDAANLDAPHDKTTTLSSLDTANESQNAGSLTVSTGQRVSGEEEPTRSTESPQEAKGAFGEVLHSAGSRLEKSRADSAKGSEAGLGGDSVLSPKTQVHRESSQLPSVDSRDMKRTGEQLMLPSEGSSHPPVSKSQFAAAEESKQPSTTNDNNPEIWMNNITSGEMREPPDIQFREVVGRLVQFHAPSEKLKRLIFVQDREENADVKEEVAETFPFGRPIEVVQGRGGQVETVEFVDVLGSGGQGIVIYAINKSHDDQEIAIKIFSKKTTKEAKAEEVLQKRERLERDILSLVPSGADAREVSEQLQVVMPLQIVQPLEHFSPPENSSTKYSDNWIVFPVFAGDLNHLELPWTASRDVKVELMHQMFLTVLNLHDRNRVHADIKTQNFFINSDGKLFLGDFSLSKTFGADASANEGTLRFLPPEHMRAKLKKERVNVSHKKDVWSLGVVFYRMWCKRRYPYHVLSHDDRKTSIHKIAGAQDVQFNMKRCHETPQVIQSLLRYMLRVNPEDRPSLRQLYEHHPFFSKPWPMQFDDTFEGSDDSDSDSGGETWVEEEESQHEQERHKHDYVAGDPKPAASSSAVKPQQPEAREAVDAQSTHAALLRSARQEGL